MAELPPSQNQQVVYSHVEGQHFFSYTKDIKAVPEVAQCVGLRSRLASRVPLEIYNEQSDESNPRHFVKRILNKPSAFGTLSDLILDVNKDLLLNRYAIVRYLRNNNKTYALHHIEFKKWKFKQNSTTKVDIEVGGKKYSVDTQNQTQNSADYWLLLDHSDMLLDQLELEVEEYVTIKKGRINRLQNAVDASVIVDMSKNPDLSKDVTVTPQQKKRMEQSREAEMEKARGAQNAGKVLYTWGSPTLVNNGGAREADFNESIRQIKQTVCSTFGMSLADLGHTENVNLANAGSMHAHLFNTVVSTDIEIICQYLSMGFKVLKELAEDERIWPNYSEVPAMQQLEEARLKLEGQKTAQAAAQADLMLKYLGLGFTAKESAKLAGLPEDQISGLDNSVRYAQTSLIPVEFNNDPQQDDETTEEEDSTDPAAPIPPAG